MLYSSVATLALAFAGTAFAQNSGNGNVDVQVVQVGSTNGTAKFYPNKITAEEGSMVQFQFMAGNHTVTQSTFDEPCVPMESDDESSPAIWSGYVPVDDSAASGMRPVFTIQVNSTDPIWLFCQTGPHCANGMVMVINEPENENTLEAYTEAAAATAEDGEGSGSGNGNGGADGESAESEGDDAEAAGSSFAAPASMLLAAGSVAFMLL